MPGRDAAGRTDTSGTGTAGGPGTAGWWDTRAVRCGPGASAPWVRTRLRTAPGPGAAMLLLVLVTSFLAAAFPRAVDTYEGEALRHELRGAPAERSSVQLSAGPPAPDAGDEAVEALRPARLAARHRAVLAAMPRSLPADAAQSSYGSRLRKPERAADGWLPQLDGGAPVFTLSAPSGLAGHSVVRTGRMPTAPREGPGAREVEAAVTTDTARVLGIGTGARIHVRRAPGFGAPLAVHVTGVLEPRHPEGGYWSVEPVLRTPAKLYTPPPVPEPYWHGALLLAPDAAPVLLSVSPNTEAYSRVAVDPSRVTADALPAVREAVASVEHGARGTALRARVSPDLEITTGLDDILVEAEGVLGSARPVVAVAAVGVGTVAGIVLVLAGGLGAVRRHFELSLLRARGGSVRGIAGRLLAESAVPVLPAAAAGCALAFLLLPAGRPLPALPASAAVALVGCAALPLRAAFLHRRLRLHGQRDDLVRTRPSRRRTVVELTLLVLAAAAVVALRRGGTAGGTADLLAGAAPVLVGVIAALLLVRLYPLPLRLAAPAAARWRGAIGFLSVARAGRAPATAALPLLALLVALTTASFGGSVLTGVGEARDRASLLAVGADARIEAEELPRGLAEEVRKAPGVDDVAAVHRSYDLDLRDGGSESVTLLAVEPGAYARLARSTGIGAFASGELRGATDALPALASPRVAARLGDAPAEVGPPAAPFTVRVAAVRDTTPAVAEGDFLVVDAAGLPAAPAPTTLLVSGPSVTAAHLGEAVRAAGAGAGARVTLRSAERAGFGETPVQRGAERVYAVAVAAGAGYAALALLLSLLQAAPERSAMLARLRTMGLTRRQGRRLLVLESLPQAVLAGAGGALVGWAAIRLLAPGVDLGRLALAARGGFAPSGAVRLSAEPWSLLLPAAAVVLLAAGVAALQAWAATRRTTTTELRAGDLTR
ncbi:FtsX-like permease family protein [Streptomyces sp. NPDC019507]|uniref:FtsX-like permease family protein n=1 Tax=Streptomyces sp. NPDC019507 TaxID=3154689 RepID=UPI00340A057A